MALDFAIEDSPLAESNTAAEFVPSYSEDDVTEPEPEKQGLFSRFRKNKKDKPSKPVPAMPRAGISGPMAELYRNAGKIVQKFDPGCGTALIMSAEKCGEAWDNVARRNPQVRRYVMALIATSANAELLMVHAPIIFAIAIHHVPAVRQMVTETTEQMTKMFQDSLNNMKIDESLNGDAPMGT